MSPEYMNGNGKRARTPEDDELDFFLAEFVLDEQTVKEAMKLLEEELINCYTKCSTPTTSPSSPLPTLATSLPPPQMNESCGSLFSHSSSTSMVDVDTTGMSITHLPYLFQHTQVFSPTKGGGCNQDSDDEWLERLLLNEPYGYEDFLSQEDQIW